jgi:hypothetical protein
MPTTPVRLFTRSNRSLAPAALLICALLCGLVAPAAARPASPAPSDEAYCDEACQWALQQQQENAITRTSFYDAPDPLPDSAMGTLLRHEPGTGYDRVSAEMSITRILYVSADSAGQPVAAAGVVLTPTSRPPRGGWPVILHAHGASGMGRECAPSLMRDLYHGDQIERFVEQGWAVVAPDYAGLGTDGRHELGNKIAAANDLLSALEAARHAVPGLRSDWLFWGHSQGGAAVLAAAEIEKVVLARLDRLAHPDRAVVEAEPPPGRAPLQHGHVPPVGIDVEVVGIQVPDDDLLLHAAASQ